MEAPMTVIIVCRCGSIVQEARALTGYTTCIVCGDQDARKEIEAKMARTGAIYNKGAMQYLGDEEVANKTLLEGGGRKHIPIQPSAPPSYSSALIPPCPQRPQRPQLPHQHQQRFLRPLRKVVGFYRIGQDRQYLYEGDDPPKSATSVVFWTN
jgi:hypothetical protein